jgi:hypothetical protein
MTLKGRLYLLERKAEPTNSEDSASLDMRLLARKIAFVLNCGIEEPNGSASEAARAIALTLLAVRDKRA